MKDFDARTRLKPIRQPAVRAGRGAAAGGFHGRPGRWRDEAGGRWRDESV